MKKSVMEYLDSKIELSEQDAQFFRDVRNELVRYQQIFAVSSAQERSQAQETAFALALQNQAIGNTRHVPVKQDRSRLHRSIPTAESFIDRIRNFVYSQPGPVHITTIYQAMPGVIHATVSKCLADLLHMGSLKKIRLGWYSKV